MKAGWNFNWLKTWSQIGFYSGLESFIKNAVYLVVVLRAMNLLNEQGSYWVANTFIWSWLLLPILPLADLVKQVCKDSNWEDFGIFIPRIVPFSSTTRQGHKKLHFLGCCCEPKQRAREEAFLDQTSTLLCVHPCDPGLVVGDLPRVEVVPGHCLERRQTGPCPGSGQTVGPMLRLLHFCQLVGRSTLRSREN